MSHALAGRELGQGYTRQKLVFRGRHQRSPGQQGDAQLGERGIEARRGELQHAACGVDAETLALRHRQARQASVANQHALGRAGRTGGVDHIGRLLWQQGQIRVLRRAVDQLGPYGWLVHDKPVETRNFGQCGQRGAVRQQQHRLGIG